MITRTYKVSDAVTSVAAELPGINWASADQIKYADEIQSLMLVGQIFDFMLAGGQPFGTVKNQQYYNYVPTDLAILKRVWLSDSATTPNVFPAEIMDSVETTPSTGRPTSVAIERGAFKFHLTPSATWTGSDGWQVNFEYYRLPRRVTATTTEFEFPDTYYYVFYAGFLARAMRYLDDERVDKQWAEFFALLQDMKADQDLESGVMLFAPQEALPI